MSELHEAHVHVLEDGSVIEHRHEEYELDNHNHEHRHEHGHSHNHEHKHSHEHEDSHVHDHEHEHNHSHGEHGHTHSHAHTKAVLNRLSRAIGHLESIKRMVESGRDCTEVMIQLSAVKSAINNTGKIILQDHIEHCIVDAVEHGDKEAIKELEKAIDRFVK